MINIGIIGTGNMANTHVTEYAKIPACRVVAACDIDRERVAAFAEKHAIDFVYTDLGQMLESGKIDAVSNVTPDAYHHPVALEAIAAGKHILCEKPLAVNYGLAREMADAAQQAGVINMVNFSYRNSSAIHHARQLISAGEIGRIVHVEACYLQGGLGTPYRSEWERRPSMLWRLSEALGSKGVLGDLGVHIVDFATYPIAPVKSLQCRLKTFGEIKGEELNGYKLDANDTAIISAELENGALASITTTRWAVGCANTIHLRVHGESGGITIDLDHSYSKLNICRGEDVETRAWQTIDCPATPNIYQRFVASITTGVNDQPDFERGAQVQKVLDACMEASKTGGTVAV